MNILIFLNSLKKISLVQQLLAYLQTRYKLRRKNKIDRKKFIHPRSAAWGNVRGRPAAGEWNVPPPPFLELDSQNHFSPFPLPYPFNLPLLSSFRCKTRRRRKRRTNEPSLPPPSCRLVGAFSLARGKEERGVFCSRKSRGGPLACPSPPSRGAAFHLRKKPDKPFHGERLAWERYFSLHAPSFPRVNIFFLLEEFAN